MDLCFQEVRNGTGRDFTASQFSCDRTALSTNGPLGAGGKERDHQAESVAAYTVGQLKDCLINILAGGTGVVETNLRVRPDRAVQVAFGRQSCAEQSTISDTLNACSAENVNQMRMAVTAILRCYGSSYRHPYDTQWQLLDVDVTGMPAERGGEGVTKGYFAGVKNRRGRQLGRVLASWYDEIVTDKLYPGKRQLNSSLPELVEEAEKALDLDESRRKRTVLRVDGGGGKDANINWMLKRQYQVMVKARIGTVPLNWRRPLPVGILTPRCPIGKSAGPPSVCLCPTHSPIGVAQTKAEWQVELSRLDFYTH